MHKGIDYGFSRTNINPKTQIRFGVIPHHEIGQFWYDSHDFTYPDEIKCYDCGEIIAATEDQCPHCEE